ncbi:hypothetical protein K438DRAFT_1956307 [Mycena galopus ATCC 62051]|nr:hypothetical protein K438DRAFT_1956307 [Mycena galopus ATCC 62051]
MSFQRKAKRRADTQFEEFSMADLLGETATFTAQYIMDDGRRTRETTHSPDLPSPLKKARQQRTPSLFADVGDGFEYVFNDIPGPSSAPKNSPRAPKACAKRYLSSDRPLLTWIPLADEYLAELIRLEGRGNVCTTHCPTCPDTVPVAVPLYRCKDCDVRDLFCNNCCVLAHVRNPLHRIERWNDSHFERVTLKSMGLRVQLGHRLGEVCDAPLAGHSNFMVVHNNCMHDVAIDYCGCTDESIVGSRRQQLLRRVWYPATHKEPRMCATFVGLETFHIMTLQWKVTTYDYYWGLEKLSDNTGLLKLDEAKDPGLATEWAYFTEDTPFRQYLLTVTDQKEMSTCSGLAALDYANTKFSHGYGSTGVGLRVCARHEFVLPNSAVDLQKGERYANMDYLVASFLRHFDIRLFKIFSYDIVCQWSKNVIERLKTLPLLVKFTLAKKLAAFVIPKLHIYGHKLLCQLYFSLNYTPGAARTDGEGIERPWASIGPVATSTSEMGPGSCHDTLDDHWGHWNWQKLIGLGDLLKKRLLKAIAKHNYQRDSLATFTQHQAEHVPGWKKMVEEFEVDDCKPNPYELPKSGATENDVRLELVREESAEQERGILPIHNFNSSVFVLAGLDLEEQQRRIKVAVAIGKKDSSKRAADLVEKRAKLSRYTARFRKLQAVYMPGVLQALAERPAPRGEKEEEAAALVENVPLFLPSALSKELRASGCNKGVAAIELCSRDAQCPSALDQIRHHLHIKSRFRTYKGGQVRHQGATTRSRDLMNRNDEKMRMYSDKYIAAWEAKRALVGKGNVAWHQLDPKKDLRCMDSEEDRALGNKRKQRGNGKGRKVGAGEPRTEEDIAAGMQQGQRRPDPTGEGRREISWIWMGVDTSSATTSEAVLRRLRVEWCKAWARTRRWTEEVCLLKEEMRCTPISLRHRATWWMARRYPLGLEDEHAEGAAAYATHQAALFTSLASSFESLWSPVRNRETVDEVARTSGTGDGESDHDEDEADEDDGNDGVDAEDDGAEDGFGDDEEEGSMGEVSQGKEEEDA